MANLKNIEEVKKVSSLMQRMATAVILVPLVISILVIGNPMFEISMLLVGILLSWEWSNIIPSKNKTFYLGAYIFPLVLMIFLSKGWALSFLALATVYTFFKSKGEEKRFLLTLGVPYISLGLGSLTWIYQDTSLLFFIWVLFVVWGMDTGGYIVGSTLKGPKLLPKVSPKKTWSGLIGGMIFAALGSGLVILYGDKLYEEVALLFMDKEEYTLNMKNVYIVISLWAMLFGFISQIGDLIESAIKRNVGVKDSSGLIPGHGGVFDRVDALIFVAPFVYVWFWFLS